MIKVNALTVSYDGVTPALDGVTLSVNQGEFVGIVGLSGSGKSTLLKSLTQLVSPLKGHIEINERRISSLKTRALRDARKQIGFVFQDYNLVERTSVLENVLMGRLGHKSSLKSFLGIFDDSDYHLALSAIDLVGLNDKIYSRANALSGGQKQRVAIAKALCQEPSILLADEPVASLDRSSTEHIMDAFQRINREKNITFMINLHDVALSKKYCHRLIGLKHGKISFDKKVGEIDDCTLQALYNQK